MIKESTIDNVRDADIVAIVSHYCELKRSGSLFECNSPFNPGDKTPSFKVSQSKNNFVCYSSQHKGDGIKFVMLKESCSFIEAVEKIAGICNILIEREEESEEVKKKRSEKEYTFKILEWAGKKYQTALGALPNDHWAKKMINDRQINEETLLTFGIGYAPSDWKYLTNPIIESAKFEMAITAGLISVKDGNSFDFFNDRLIFPIEDVNGNVVGFGGRCSDDNPAKDSGRKYVNSKESFVYQKSKVLYGLFQAKNNIVKSKTAILTEGYTDVTSLHQNGCDIAVASGGTALTDDQCKLLSRFASHVIICRDNDGYDTNGNPKAGLKAALSDIDKLLLNNLKVSVVIFPEGEDPDSFSRKNEDIKQYIFDNAQDAVLWKTNFLLNKAANDPNMLSECVSGVAEMLFCIKDDVKHNSYVSSCARIVRQPVKLLKQKIELISETIIHKAEKQGVVDVSTAEDLGLPAGADFEEFKKYRYVTIGNTCWFQGRNGSFFKGTNYRITPLFHVYGKNDNKRLCEAINELNSKKLIDFESTDFVSRNKFDEVLIKEGFFVNLENFGATQFTMMRNRILSDFIMAFELKTLGWQREGFWAFANCVYNNGIIKNVNSYGIFQVETESKTEVSEYYEDVKHYYSPAFSEIYAHNREGDDPYENDRFFVYKKAPVSIDQWMNQMYVVYGKKAITGIACVFFSLFRDLFVKTHAVSPILFLSGEKGSGKSKFAESMASVFTYKQPAFDLNSGTIVGFSRRIARTTNALTLLEEFNDYIDVKMLQSIKGSYDNRGRETGVATGDNRTKMTKVNCFLVILSQYLSSWDDNSITSRSIIQHFIKPQENFSEQEIKNYNLLKSWEESGLTSLVIDILQYRSDVENNYNVVYADLIKKFQKEIKGYEYQERMLQNYTVILTPIKILWDKFKFPFTFEEMYEDFKNSIVDSSDLIIESEGLAEFWRTLEYLLDRKPYSLITPGIHFIIDTPMSLSLQTRKGESDKAWHNNDRQRVLMLRLNAVHQLYHKEVSTREGVDVIGENTLRNYFKSKKYFIGAVKSHRFDDTSTSAYVFNYDMMHENGILNLVRNSRIENHDTEPEKKSVPVTASNDDELPF